MDKNRMRNIKNKYRIKKLGAESEIYKALLDISDAHSPPLLEKVPNLKDYAKKLLYNAEVYAIVESNTLGLIAFYSNDNESKVSYITQLAVQPYVQNMHLGKQLLDICFQVSIAKGMLKVRLEVNNNNLHALHFYERNGFVFCKEASTESMYLEKRL